MPKSTGRVRQSFKIVFPERVSYGKTQTAVGGGLPELAAIPLEAAKHEEIIVTQLGYCVRLTEPEDDMEIAIYLSKGQDASVGYAAQDLQEVAQDAIFCDWKFYELSGTDFYGIESMNYVDLDPDQPLKGESEECQLEVWVYCNGAKSIVTTFLMYYIKKLEQRIHRNDNAFMDYSWEEIVGNIV